MGRQILEKRTAHRAVATGASLRAIDWNDFALVGPVFGALDQAGVQSIFADVIPFLTHAFIAAEQVIEKTFLPDLSS